MNDLLISFGGALKITEDGRMTGYLVRFTDEDSTDLAGEFFTKSTDFGIVSGAKTPIYFNHRLPLQTKDGGEIVIKAKIGEGTLTIEDEGVVIDAIVFNRTEYEKAIIKAGKAGLLGWSSGTAAHLVDKEVKGEGIWLKQWPLGLDGSLTPMPCEPRNSAAFTAKSYQDALLNADLPDLSLKSNSKPMSRTSLGERLSRHVLDMVDSGLKREDIIAKMAREAGVDTRAVEGVLIGRDQPSEAKLRAFARALEVEFEPLKGAIRRDHARTVKGMFEERLAEEKASRWHLESVYCDIVSKLASAASASKLAGITFDLEAKVREATDEYTARLFDLAYTQVTEYVESGEDEPFYLKAAIDDEQGIDALKVLDFDTHSRLLVTGMNGIAKRFRVNHESRVRENRLLSDRNRARIVELLGEVKGVTENLEGLLHESTPMATETEKRIAQTAFLRQQWRANQLGANNEATGTA